MASNSKTKPITPANMRALAIELIDYFNEQDYWFDMGIYVDGERWSSNPVKPSVDPEEKKTEKGTVYYVEKDINVEEYLEECVNSVLSQDCSDYEIVLVDDGSLDKSGAICDRLQKEHDCIRAYLKVNGGLSSARNYGTERALGKYIYYLDSDDFADLVNQERYFSNETFMANFAFALATNFTRINFVFTSTIGTFFCIACNHRKMRGTRRTFNRNLFAINALYLIIGICIYALTNKNSYDYHSYNR